MSSKHNNTLGVTEPLTMRKKLPADYHCNCPYCKKNFLGEIYDVKNDQYYSQLARKKYYDPNAGKHIAPGHFLGYRWAIQNLTKKGDWVFDPTVGTGTAIVEAINHGRNGVGIELEFPEIARKNIEFQFKRKENPPTGGYKFLPGDALQMDKLLKKVPKGSVQLVINGTPYPIMGSGISSDAPERYLAGEKAPKNEPVRVINYKNESNIGLTRGKAYWDLVTKLYTGCVPYMKKKGKMVILIKDLMSNKQAFLLHRMIIDNILQNNPELKYYGSFMHRHVPETLFMRTYPKRFPGVKVPMYQTGIILEKI